MSSTQERVEFFDKNGLRTDGRKFDEIRPMSIKIGVLSRADGSCYLEWGANKILAAVYGPREVHPRRLQKADRAIVRYRYNMQSFSVEDRARPGTSRRSVEISKVSREAFESVILTELYPGSVIDIFVEVLQADAGTRTAAINAASVALVDAGIPMKSIVSSCAVGKVGGKIVLDLNKIEDNFGEADLPVAMTQDGDVTLIQMDGNLTADEFKEALKLVETGCRTVHKIQKKALMEKFGISDESANEEEDEMSDDFDEDEEDEASDFDDEDDGENEDEMSDDFDDEDEDGASDDFDDDDDDEMSDFDDEDDGEDEDESADDFDDEDDDEMSDDFDEDEDDASDDFDDDDASDDFDDDDEDDGEAEDTDESSKSNKSADSKLSNVKTKRGASKRRTKNSKNNRSQNGSD